MKVRTLGQVAEFTTAALRTLLDEQGEFLRPLPGVVGWGVGLGSDGDPTIQVFFSAPPPDPVARQLPQLFDRFEVVIQSRPADAP